MSVLIISGIKDRHADSLEKQLNNLNISVHRFSYSDISTGEVKISLIPNDINKSMLEFYDRETLTEVDGMPETKIIPQYKLYFSEITAIYFHKKSTIKILDFTDDFGEAFYIRKEMTELVESLWTLLSDKHWINHPEKVLKATKPVQLHLACEIGFQIPRTIITDSENSLNDFIMSEPRIAYKSIGDGGVYEFDELGNPLTLKARLYTELIDRGNAIESLNNISSTLSIVQSVINKLSDVRVIVIGDQAFAFEIISSISSDGDWRKNNEEKLRYVLHILPSDIYEKCILLTEKLGLEYGAIDLALTDQGYVFFELNPSGAWIWLQDSCKIPISSYIAKFIEKMITGDVN